MHLSLGDFIAALKKENEIIEISASVDPYLELAEIHRRVISDKGPAILFTNVKNSTFPVVTNLFGSKKRVEIAFGQKPENITKNLLRLMDSVVPPTLGNIWKSRKTIWDLLKVGTKKQKKSPVLKNQSSGLDTLPKITSWIEDGGPFITLPLVYTEGLDGKSNLGMYRMQFYDNDTTGIHWQIHKGGGFHYHSYEQNNLPLKVNVFLGGPPALIASAISPLPENVPEILLASLLMGKKIATNNSDGYPIISNCEFVLTGSVYPHERRLEGPFGDHYGYYSLEHDFPVFHLQKLFHKDNAIYPATIVGKPRQEDYYLGEFLQELLSPIFPIVMPGIKSLWAYAESGVHALASAVVRESYSKESLVHGLRILGEGQLSLTKFLILTDQNLDLKNFKNLFENVLLRLNPAEDLLILGSTSMDTLDYTGRKFNHGSKAILRGTGEIRNQLSNVYTGPNILEAQNIVTYCRGCFLVETDNYTSKPNMAKEILHKYGERMKDPCIIFLVDDSSIVKDQESFLWTVFMRFDPAFDLLSNQRIANNHIQYTFPLIIDARMKPLYPKEVEVDSETKSLVDNRWLQYFTT